MPAVKLTIAPRPVSETLFQAHFSWSAFDPDGQVERCIYPVDSPVVTRSFTARTVAPETFFNVPTPDDFCRDFFGGTDGPPAVVPYSLADVITALGRVSLGDWASLFATRIDSVRAEPPLAGIDAAGWGVAYADSANALSELVDSARGRTDYRYSLGFRVGKNGTVPDVLPDSPAARAGMASGMKLIAVDGRLWSHDALDDALASTRPVEPDPARAADAGPRGRSSIELLATQGDFVQTYRLEGLAGPRHPTLGRRPGTPDVLASILAARAGPNPQR